MYPSTERFVARIRAILDHNRVSYIDVTAGGAEVVVTSGSYQDRQQTISLLRTYDVPAEGWGTVLTRIPGVVSERADPGWCMGDDGFPEILADDLLLIRYTDTGPDSLGRRQFMAWWRGHGPLGGEPGSRATGCCAVPAEHIERARAEGRRVIEVEVAAESAVELGE